MKRKWFVASYLVCLLLFSVFVPTTAVFADDQAELIGWWKMDGAIGDNQRLVKDYSGNGHDGTMGTSDSWIAGGGIDFDGGSGGASGIVFENNGADIAAALTDKVTISYIVTWDAFTVANYPYDGRDSADAPVFSSECPSVDGHIHDYKGGTDTWYLDAFNEAESLFIFGKVGKTWGDYIRITTMVDFTTGFCHMYVDDVYYAGARGKYGSFEDMVSFTIGRTLGAEMQGKMKDFRIYDGILSEVELTKLVDPDYGLLLRYNFDETSGDVAFDSSGNEYDAAFNRSDRWDSQGQWGGCLSNDDAWGVLYGEVPVEAFSHLGDKFTVAFWAKNTANCDIYGSSGFFKGSSDGSSVLTSSVYKSTSTTPYGHYLITRAGSNDETGYWWWGYSDIYYDQVNQWHHIAFTVDHTAKMVTKYYDGKAFTIARLLSTDSCDGIDLFRFFCRSTGDASAIQYYDCYHGLLDEFNIYSRILTLEELHKLSSESPEFAYHPYPADGEVLQDRQLLLSFSAADSAIGHQIYFGTDYDAVDVADVNSKVFAGSFALGQTNFDPGYLRGGRQYYWRVDEVFAWGVVKGQMWSFSAIKNNIDLYLYMGQSNMCVSADVEPEDNIPDLHIVRFDKRDSEWKLLDPNDVSGIGPAPSFSVGMIADREDTVVGIVHAAVSGTPQVRWLKGGDLYEAAMVRAKDAMEFGTMKGVLWHQGESEARDIVKATAYGDNLKDMIADIRADLGVADLPFVLGQLGDFNLQTYNYIINAGIQSAADDTYNVEVASPAGLTGWDDDTHFTSESQRIYGFRYAAKMMEMVGPRVSTADIDDDGNVDLVDLGLIAEKWLEFSDYGDSKDINNDGEINSYDFLIMGQQWGQ